ADGCATHLRRQAEALRIRKVAGMPINVFDKRHRVAPDLQTLVGTPSSRIPNPESRIPLHRYQPITNSGWSNSTGWPLSHWIASTVPATSAAIGWNIFIASMMPSVSPALAVLPLLTAAGWDGAGDGGAGAGVG